jgi:hypothetical protein
MNSEQQALVDSHLPLVEHLVLRASASSPATSTAAS